MSSGLARYHSQPTRRASAVVGIRTSSSRTRRVDEVGAGSSMVQERSYADFVDGTGDHLLLTYRSAISVRRFRLVSQSATRLARWRAERRARISSRTSAKGLTPDAVE